MPRSYEIVFIVRSYLQFHVIVHSEFSATDPTENELFSNRSTWALDGTLADSTSPGKSRSGSNGNEGVLHISPISITETSPSNEICCHALDTIKFSLNGT